MAGELRGVCELCGFEASRAEIARHLAACAPEHDKGARADTLVQLQVEGDAEPAYWLHVEGRASATLQQLDALLRRVWLECCGHMSQFALGRVELSKRSPLGSLQPKGPAFTYEYDFGSTTALRGRVLGQREGSLGSNALRVVARNAPLELACADCGEAATLVCPFCLDSEPTLFCPVHAPQHPCAEEEVFLPVVNSPRMGVCGYRG